MNWEYWADTTTWLYGKPDNGAGIFNDGDGYYINIAESKLIDHLAE